MPQNRYFLPQLLKANDKVIVRDSEFHHMTRVMRQKVGDVVEIINGSGALAVGEIAAIKKENAEVVIQTAQAKPAPTYSLTLALAFLKPANLEFALEKVVELGVTEILLFPANRCEKKALSDLYLKRLETIIISACKQCGRLFLPKLIVKKSLAECIRPNQTAFFGDLEASSTFDKESSAAKDIALFIGPESGFSEDEVKLMRTQGVQGIRFHQNTLRAETAAIAGIAILNAS